MKGMPKDGHFVKGQPDPVSGQAWVHVSRDMALGHPQGRLGLALYGVVLLLIAHAGLRLAVWSAGGGTWYLLEALFALLAGAALFLRVPPGAWMALISCVFILVDFATGPMPPWQLGEALLAVVAGFYLLTGARPNLIYRHRYLARDEGE